MKDLVEFKIKQDELPVFVIYFLLGILHSIKNNKVSPDVGIWTIAHPTFREFLEGAANIPQELSEVIQSCDELAMEGRIYDDFLNERIAILEKLLEGYKNHDVFPSFHWLSGMVPNEQ
jgi:hypothetical protein